MNAITYNKKLNLVITDNSTWLEDKDNKTSHLLCHLTLIDLKPLSTMAHVHHHLSLPMSSLYITTNKTLPQSQVHTSPLPHK